MNWLFVAPIVNFVESFVDNVIFDKVTPKIGSVVYCDLALGYAEHTGIYIGNNEIVHLNRKGMIETVSPESFIRGTSAISIYVSSYGDRSVGSSAVAERAKAQIGNCREYNVILDNCHQFTAGCLTGDFENSNNFLWMVKDTAREELGSDNWRVWNL